MQGRNTGSGDLDNTRQDVVADSEDLGAWGVPKNLENDNADEGYPAGIGMPGIFSGSDNELPDDDLHTDEAERTGDLRHPIQ